MELINMSTNKQKVEPLKANVEMRDGSVLEKIPMRTAERIVNRAMEMSGQPMVAVEPVTSSKTLGYSHIPDQDWKKVFRRK
jgi:hypothetical protein